MQLYRDIIKKSLQIAWRYKFLWFFGFFASILGTGEIGLLINSVDDLTNQSGSTGTLQLLLTVKMWILAFFNIFSVPFTVAVFMIGLLLVLLIIIWMIFTSVAGIVGATAVIEQGKRQTFDGVWKIGSANFWPVLGVNLALRIISMMILLAGIPLVQFSASNSSSQGIIPFILYFSVIFLPSIFILSLLAKYATGYIVIKKKTFSEAIIASVKLFQSNWIISLEMVLVIAGIYIAAGLGYVIIAGIITTVLKIFAFVGFIAAPSAWWHVGTTALALMIYAIIILLLGSVLSVVEYVGWAKLFLRIEEGKATSKILRIANLLPKYLK